MCHSGEVSEHNDRLPQRADRRTRVVTPGNGNLGDGEAETLGDRKELDVERKTLGL